MQKTKKILLYMIFVVYCASLLWLLFGARIAALSNVSEEIRNMGYFARLCDHINLIPGATIYEYSIDMLIPSAKIKSMIASINLIGNLALFLPMGFLLPCISTKFKSFIKITLWVTVIVALVELTQLVTLLGMCDIDDLILNVLGAQIGYLIYKIFSMFKLNIEKEARKEAP